MGSFSYAILIYMKLITYQNKKAVDILLTTGELKITKSEDMKTYHRFDNFGVSSFKEVYEYINDRMHKLINNDDLDDKIISPIWGWYKYPSIDELNIDNPDMYRIELEIDEDKVLLSDFDYYENIAIAGLDFFNLSKRKKEEIYSLGKHALFKEYDRMISKYRLSRAKYIQATFWKLKKEYVISITRVKGEEIIYG